MSAALNISTAIGFQEGIFEAIMLKSFTLELTGNIQGAFQLAVLLKTLDLKVNKLNDVYAAAAILTQQEVKQPREVIRIVTYFLIGIVFGCFTQINWRRLCMVKCICCVTPFTARSALSVLL